MFDFTFCSFDTITEIIRLTKELGFRASFCVTGGVYKIIFNHFGEWLHNISFFENIIFDIVSVEKLLPLCTTLIQPRFTEILSAFA